MEEVQRQCKTLKQQEQEKQNAYEQVRREQLFEKEEDFKKACMKPAELERRQKAIDAYEEELRRSCQEVEWLRSQLKEKEAPDLEQTEKELKEQTAEAEGERTPKALQPTRDESAGKPKTAATDEGERRTAKTVSGTEYSESHCQREPYRHGKDRSGIVYAASVFSAYDPMCQSSSGADGCRTVFAKMQKYGKPFHSGEYRS